LKLGDSWESWLLATRKGCVIILEKKLKIIAALKSGKSQ